MLRLGSRLSRRLGPELSRMVGHSAFVFGCTATSAVLAFCTQVLLARWVGANEFGLYVFANSLCIILADLSALGYPGTAYRFVGGGLAHADRRGLRGFVRRSAQMVLATSLIVALAGAAGAWAAQSLLPQGYLWPVVIAFLSVPILAVMRLHGAVANSFAWFALAHLPISVLRGIFFLLTISAVWSVGIALSGTKAIALQSLILLMLGLGQWIILRQALRTALGGIKPTYDTALWLRTALPMLLIILCTSSFREVSVVVAAMFMSPDEVGVYNAGLRIAILIAFGLGSVDAVTMPGAARLYVENNVQSLQKLVTRATRLKFLGSAFAILILVVFGKQLLSIFGEQFVHGYVSLLILALAQFLIGAGGPLAELLTATGHQDRCLLVFAVVLTAAVGLNALLIPPFGIEGAATATLLATCLRVAWLHGMVVRHIGVKPSILHPMR